MITYLICMVALVAGYVIYGKIVDDQFGPTDAKTPALLHADGVDYVPMSTPRIFLIQLLNIAGLGPIFGALSGALWGPVAYLWVVFGNIFGGAVHDYFAGMISLRHNGASISEIVGIYLGSKIKLVMRIFSVVLLVLVGVVFMTGPAALLAMLTPESLDFTFWLWVILIYYFCATFLPVDKLIGRIYPLFGFVLLFMAFGVGTMILFSGHHMPELTLDNLHPAKLAIWPFMFVTIACGAVSGFHATQSPMMARCIQTERDGRKVFYGAMIAEGIIAIVWIAAGITFYDGTPGLAKAMTTLKGPGPVVYDVSFKMLGTFGGILAMIGVIACPITSGDTAFRSARLTLADWFNIDQAPISKRLLIAVPMLSVGYILTKMDFSILWRYFAWSNQTLAMFTLWAAAMYLAKNNKNYWMAVVPAIFMSAVSVTYILQAPEGFKLSTSISYPAGVIGAIICFVLFMMNKPKQA